MRPPGVIFISLGVLGDSNLPHHVTITWDIPSRIYSIRWSREVAIFSYFPDIPAHQHYPGHLPKTWVSKAFPGNSDLVVCVSVVVLRLL
jgi:hypothetical protein